ncbi:MAG TPA: hypothetical protein DCE62_01945 [Glaciecola sp.]|nr:hypothetical protein [Glaciecola sp.]HAB79025.1 hypothetical protein [Glaciecola sp.]HAQ48128.1 hypothetical protein [Glaciecola sp.]HCF78148.1 hypothetical protein [Glaciecola sp.]
MKSQSTYIAKSGTLCLVDARLTIKLDRQLKQRIISSALEQGHSDPAEYVLAIILAQIPLKKSVS